MKLKKATKPLRLLFMNAALIQWLGIWLTGFGTTHWVLYWPAAFFSFAAITGICPGLMITRAIFRE